MRPSSFSRFFCQASSYTLRQRIGALCMALLALGQPAMAASTYTYYHALPGLVVTQPGNGGSSNGNNGGTSGGNGGVATGQFTFSSLSPSAVSTNGGLVTITGSNLTSDLIVKINGVTVPASFVDEGHFSVMAPAHAQGQVSVEVVGKKYTPPAKTLQYLPDLVVSNNGINPSWSYENANTSIVVTGSGFVPDMKVNLVTRTGTIPAASVSVLNDTQFTFTAPAAQGDYNISLTDGYGRAYSSYATLSVVPLPADIRVTGLNPLNYPSSGGTLTVSGSGFSQTTRVLIDGMPAKILTVNPSALTVQVPAMQANMSVPVTVDNSNPSHGAVTVSAGFLRYFVDASVSHFAPVTGRAGTPMTITLTGSGLTPDMRLTLTQSDGSIIDASVTVASETSLTATLTPSVAGIAVFNLKSINGKTVPIPGTLNVQPRLVDASISALSQPYASVAGGEAITVTGTGFSSGTTVSLSGVAEPITPVVTSSNQLSFITPSHAAGIVTVTVDNQTGGGKGIASLLYVNPLTVSGASPQVLTGNAHGEVTVTGTGLSSMQGGTVTVVPANGLSSTASVSVVVSDTEIRFVLPIMSSNSNGLSALVLQDTYGRKITTMGLLTVLSAPEYGDFNLAPKTFGDPDITLTEPVSSSPAPFSYSSSNPAVAKVIGNVVQIVGVGTTTIKASQEASGLLAAGSVSSTLAVSAGNSMPILSSISPFYLERGRLNSITIKGRGFLPGIMVATQNNGYYGQATISSVTDRSITATTASGLTAGMSQTYANITLNNQVGNSPNSDTALMPVVSPLENNITVNFGGGNFFNYRLGVVPGETGAVIDIPVNTMVDIGLTGDFLTDLSSHQNDIGYQISAWVVDINGNTYSLGSRDGSQITTMISVGKVINTKITLPFVGLASLVLKDTLGRSYTMNGILNARLKTISYGAFTIPDKMIGDADFSVTPPASPSSMPFTYTSSDPSIATINNSGQIHILKTGAVTITASQAAGGDYKSAATTATLTIRQPPVTGSLNVPTMSAGQIANLTTPTSNSAGTWSYSSSNTNVATVNDAGRVTAFHAGTTVITATQAASGNFSSASTTATLTVNPASPSLGAFTVGTYESDAGTVTLTPPSSTGSGAWSYSIDNTSVATITGNQMTLKAAGTATVTATQAAAGDYTTGTASASLTVSKLNAFQIRDNVGVAYSGAATVGGAAGGSYTLPVRIYNNKAYAVSVSSLTLSDTSNASVEQSCVKSIAANSYCTATITYTPTQAESKTVTLSVSGANTQTATQSISMNATSVAKSYVGGYTNSYASAPASISLSLPAGVVAGDYLVIFSTQAGGSSSLSGGTTVNYGWTSYGYSSALMTKKLTAADIGANSVMITNTVAGSPEVIYTLMAFRGYSTMYGMQGGATATANLSSYTAASVNGINGGLALYYVADRSRTVIPSSSGGMPAVPNTGKLVTYFGINVFSKSLTTSGATGTQGFAGGSTYNGVVIPVVIN